MAKGMEYEVISCYALSGSELQFTIRTGVVDPSLAGGSFDWMIDVVWNQDTETGAQFVAKRAAAIRAKAAELGLSIPANRVAVISYTLG